MTKQKVINAARRGAQINDRDRKSSICEESENDTFRFLWSKKFRLDFLRPYQQLQGGYDEKGLSACLRPRDPGTPGHRYGRRTPR
jgi:hypothetical protein